MAQKFCGEVTDEDGFKHEVWVSLLPDDTIEHVFVMYEGTQVTDFPFGQPNKDCDLSEAAQQVATGRTRSVTLPILIEVE
ncbi:hypothetical protein KC887_06585 [Candidatus Kaiserbacteria bacterium]|nr:hypothetical protein [Candidatus Kaiserbacteria bacterium]